jgi:hypothetical protein
MTGRRTLVSLIVCLATGIGCTDKYSVPGDILPRDKMQELMWDMAEADQYSALFLAKDSGLINVKAETLRLYEEVFRLHHVTREEFRKSYHYYLDHPALSQALFDSVYARGVKARSDLAERPAVYHGPVAAPKPGLAAAATAGATVGMRNAGPGGVPRGGPGGGPVATPFRNMPGIDGRLPASDGRVPGLGGRMPGGVGMPGGPVRPVTPKTALPKRDTVPKP